MKTPKQRTPRQETYLKLARLLWLDCMDGEAVSLTNDIVRKEFWRLVKLAKATKEDL